MGFEQLAGLWVLMGIIPFVLIYFVRPKSFERAIPSLMFIMHERFKTRRASFLQKLLHNLLFFLQLLALVALGLAAASPFMDISHRVLVKNSIIVVDVSASMASQEDGSTRLAQAVGLAKDNLGMRNTIILAGNVPVLALESGSRSEAYELLSSLKPKAVSTNIGDAMLLAEDLAAGQRAVISVVSDFINTEGSDIIVAKQSLTLKGNTVRLLKVGKQGKNIGITSLEVDKSKTAATVKNFDEDSRSFSIALQQGAQELSKKEMVLPGKSKETLEFPTPQGSSKITIEGNDDLPLDNTAYISNPLKQRYKVLIITNFPRGNKIKTAFSAMKDVELETREPPTINAYNINHDLVIISGITPKLFVPSDYKDIKRYIERGGMVVFAAQQSLVEVYNTLVNEQLQEMFPVIIQGKEDKQSAICADLIGPVFTKEPFADEPCFTVANSYFRAAAKNDTLTLASAQLDNSPIIVTSKRGNGNVFYYGIIDPSAGFFSDPYYPIFWRNALTFLLKTENIATFNQKGGQIVPVREQEISTPSGNVKANRVAFDESGIYRYDGKEVAVNLADEGESDISAEPAIDASVEAQHAEESEQMTERFAFAIPLIILVLVLLGLETIALKMRGDF